MENKKYKIELKIIPDFEGEVVKPPITVRTDKRKKAPVAKGNPFQITRNQHLLPKKILDRISGNRKLLDVVSLRHKIKTHVSTDNPLFCVNRCWDENCETKISKPIEDDFQRLCDKIESNTEMSFSKDQNDICNRLYNLWYLRGNFSKNPLNDIYLSKIKTFSTIEQMKKDELEKNNIIYGENGKIDSRFIHGLIINHELKTLMDKSYKYWYIWVFEEGDYIFSIIPLFQAIPVTRNIVLMPIPQNKSRNENRTTKSFNRQIIEKSYKYSDIFASYNIDNCLGIRADI
ncbi:hypothetical protein [Neokomagataea anthophila]|uniref:Uncharacterized protein n=1 Tax=Neokomagataea anthophila TaxID=2826925 RepID=A0ABS5E9C1_9PROT|nr:hypothetical protein [Neokomagataea anthophila]MBR0560504.1 hypothetical protein [Neokomagataea anthophila]